MTVLEVGDADTHEVAIPKGDTCVVSLPWFGFSGYLWSVRCDPQAVEAVLVPPPAGRKPSADDPVPGPRIPVRYAVRALMAGRHPVTFELARPWEGTPRRTVTVAVEAA